MLQNRPVTTAMALFVGGAAIGAGVGLLFAPWSGAETRRIVGRKAKRAQVQATRFGRRIKNGIDHTVEKGRALVTTAA